MSRSSKHAAGYREPRRSAAARQPRRSLRVERQHADASTATSSRCEPSRTTARRRRPARATRSNRRAATTTAACSRSAPTASSTSWLAISAAAASCRTCRRADAPAWADGPDDQFGGPSPTIAHFSGRHPAAERRRHDADRQSVLRRRTRDRRRGRRRTSSGSSPTASATASGWRSIRAQAQLWQQENGEDAFDEINRVEPGMNSGWIQITGPSTRRRVQGDRDDLAAP